MHDVTRPAPHPGDPASSREAIRWATISWAAASTVLLVKAVAWWVSRSSVLLADAAESGIDVFTAALMVMAIRLARRPADASHPWGHGKAEYFSAGFQGALIMGTGVLLIVDTVQRISGATEPPNLEMGLGMSLAGTLINLALAISLIRVGRRLHSPALTSDGRHNLADVWTTVGGWAGLGIAWVTGVWMLDPIVAIGVSLHIVWVGAKVTREAVNGLMDAAAPPKDVAQIEETIRENLGAALEFHDLRTRRSSESLFVEFHLIVDGHMSVDESHRLCDRIETALSKRLPTSRTTIHVEPTSERHGH